MGYKLNKAAVETLKEMIDENDTSLAALRSMKPVEKEYMSNEEADKMLRDALGGTFEAIEYENRLLELQLEHSAWRAKATTIGVVFGLTMYCLGLAMGGWL